MALQDKSLVTFFLGLLFHDSTALDQQPWQCLTLLLIDCQVCATAKFFCFSHMSCFCWKRFLNKNRSDYYFSSHSVSSSKTFCCSVKASTWKVQIPVKRNYIFSEEADGLYTIHYWISYFHSYSAQWKLCLFAKGNAKKAKNMQAN